MTCAHMHTINIFGYSYTIFSLITKKICFYSMYDFFAYQSELLHQNKPNTNFKVTTSWTDKYASNNSSGLIFLLAKPGKYEE